MMELVFTRAKLLSGVEDERQLALLQMFCQAAVSTLTARLRDGLMPEDCEADFVAAASLMALAAFLQTDQMATLQQIQLGDVSLRTDGGSMTAECLRKQAEMMMSPYCADGFSFRGV